MLTTRNRAMESSSGLMVVATRETGKEVSNMEKVCMLQVKALKNMENGKTAKESDGSEKMLVPLTSEENLYINYASNKYYNKHA